LDLLSSLGPDKIAREYSALETRREQQAKPSNDRPFLPHLIMPAHHDVRSSDVIARRLHGNLAAAADRGPKDFSRFAANARRRRADGAGPRDGCRSDAWRTMSV